MTPIGDHDVVVPLLSDELTRAKAVLKRLRELGHVQSENSNYMKASLPQGSLGADAEAKRRLAESLATDAPSVAAEWDVVRNEGLTPRDVTSGSGRKVWWLCSKCGFSWQAAVGSRARNGHGCPDCGRRASVNSLRAQSGRSLAERFPHLIAEWHPTRNGDLTPETVRCASHRPSGGAAHAATSGTRNQKPATRKSPLPEMSRSSKRQWRLRSVSFRDLSELTDVRR